MRHYALRRLTTSNRFPYELTFMLNHLFYKLSMCFNVKKNLLSLFETADPPMFAWISLDWLEVFRKPFEFCQWTFPTLFHYDLIVKARYLIEIPDSLNHPSFTVK